MLSSRLTSIQRFSIGNSTGLFPCQAMSPSLKSLGFHSVPVLGLPSVMSENSSCSKMSLDISGKSLALVCELVSLSLCVVVASVFSSTSLTSYQRSRSVPAASGEAQRGLCSPSCPKRESPVSVNASPSRQCGTSNAQPDRVQE